MKGEDLKQEQEGQEEQEKQSEITRRGAAIKLPKEQIAFLRKNPKLAEIVGTAFLLLSELIENANNMRKTLNTPELFLPSLENGTKEELEKFLKVLVDSNESEKVISLDNFTNEDYVKLKEAFGEEHILETIFKSEKQTESKEAEVNL
jgi:hypothetical protein